MPAFSRPSQFLPVMTMSNSAAGTAGAVSLTIPGTIGADTLAGTEQDDTIDGGAGNDTINGLGGKDTLNGGDGHDVLDGGDGDDVLDGGSGNDRLVGHVGNDTLRGGDGDDEIEASFFGSSVLEGGVGKDRLRSHGGGDDRLSGGDGDDSLLLMEHNAGDRGATITLSGGTGDDTISMVLVNRAASVLASGGDGADLFNIGSNIGGGKVRILDFGASDRLDLQEWLPYGITDNPFGAGGYWKAVQEGADVAIHIDRDGAAGPNAALRLLTLANVSLASLTAANFVGGFDPAGASPGGGGPIGLTLTGTAGHDTLIGRDLNDAIDGRAGNDYLRGEGGDDTLSGGDGDDNLDGGAGNDRLEGGAGNDTLSDSPGDDYLSGGAGDDILTSIDALPGRPAGTTLDGGAGKDRLHAGAAVKTVLGGAGDDEVMIEADGRPGNMGQMNIDLGGGDDRLAFRTGTGDARALRVSGGAGSDTYSFGGNHSWPVLTITDFQTGAGGDVLDVYTFFGFRGGNPFDPSGPARLVQEGSRVLFQVDGDEDPFTQTWATRVVFENTLVEDFTADNFPGADPGGPVLNGSAGNDALFGTEIPETLRGGGGDDHLHGNGGNDRLYGDGGNDLVIGGAGNDLLEGGAGNDTLLGEEGDDRLYGGAGDDFLGDGRGNNALYGGEGNDTLVGPTDGHARVFGEAGNDVFHVGGASGEFDGGDGHDGFHLSFDSASTGSFVLTGGAGRDNYKPGSGPSGATVTITDFETGIEGDFLNLTGLVSPTSGNPFMPGGALQFVQRGVDAVLQARVAVNGAVSFQDVLVLRGVSKDAVSSYNFSYEFGSNNGILYQGTGSADLSNGDVHDDILKGYGGADVLYGRDGNDRLDGGSGNDRLDGGSGIDTAVFSGARAQYSLPQRLSPDMVVSDRRSGGDGRDQLTGIERLVFADGAIALDTGAADKAGQAYRIYRAAFDREPDLGGLGFWIARLDQGVTLLEMAAAFVRSDEFTGKYGAAPDNTDIVTRLYRNILDREPEQGGLDFYVSVLDRKAATLGEVLADFSESRENREGVAELIGNGIAYLPDGG